MSYGIQRVTKAITIASSGTTNSATGVALNGLLRGIQVNAPDLDSTNTYTLTITDQDGYTTFTKASIAENSRYTAFVDANNQPLQLPLTGHIHDRHHHVWDTDGRSGVCGDYSGSAVADPQTSLRLGPDRVPTYEYT